MSLRRSALLGAALTLAAVGGAGAQSPRPPAGPEAPPGIDGTRPAPSRPRGAPEDGAGDPSGARAAEEGAGGVARGVIRPPAGLDPGIHTTVPDPTPGTTRVIPPPGTAGGDPRVQPR